MVNTIYLFSFVDTPRKFIIAELSIRKLGPSSVLIIPIISTDEDPSLRIESSAIINLRGVSTKLNKYNFPSCFHDTMKRLLCDVLCDCLKLELYRLQKTVVLIAKSKQKRQAKNARFTVLLQ